MPTINYGLQGRRLTPPPPYLRDYYLGYAGRDYLGGQYPGSRTLNLNGAGYETRQQAILAPGDTANAKEVRGGWASSAPGTMARTRGWPTPPGKYARRSWATGATTRGAPGRCLTGAPPTGAGVAQVPARGAGGGAAHAHDQLRAAGVVAHAPARLKDYYFGYAGRNYFGGLYPGSVPSTERVTRCIGMQYLRQEI